VGERFSFAVQDTLHPDRLIFGAESAWAMEQLYASFAPIVADAIPVVEADLPTAELVKVAANSFLATKISYINAMAEVCEVTSADVKVLPEALGLDDRIGKRFLQPGLGFGGGCLPKDIRAFRHQADELGVGQPVRFLGEVDAINIRRRTRTVDLVHELVGPDLRGVRIAALGATFKPNSDDVRDAPALDVARMLSMEGGTVVVYDPEGMEERCQDLPGRGLRRVGAGSRPGCGRGGPAHRVGRIQECRSGIAWVSSSAADRLSMPDTRSTCVAGSRPTGPSGPWDARSTKSRLESPGSLTVCL
jgi:nucleotide sugar dehydrogenase